MAGLFTTLAGRGGFAGGAFVAALGATTAGLTGTALAATGGAGAAFGVDGVVPVATAFGAAALAVCVPDFVVEAAPGVDAAAAAPLTPLAPCWRIFSRRCCTI